MKFTRTSTETITQTKTNSQSLGILLTGITDAKLRKTIEAHLATDRVTRIVRSLVPALNYGGLNAVEVNTGTRLARTTVESVTDGIGEIVVGEGLKPGEIAYRIVSALIERSAEVTGLREDAIHREIGMPASFSELAIDDDDGALARFNRGELDQPQAPRDALEAFSQAHAAKSRAARESREKAECEAREKREAERRAEEARPRSITYYENLAAFGGRE